jgi:hypothetical protein
VLACHRRCWSLPANPEISKGRARSISPWQRVISGALRGLLLSFLKKRAVDWGFAVVSGLRHSQDDMSCGRWGSLLLSVGLCACATAPVAGRTKPAPPPEDASEYYPLQSGWRWAYDIEKGGEHILAIYAVVQRNGQVAVLQAGEERLMYAVLPEGIVRGEPTKENEKGDFLLKSPIRLGAQWPILGGTATVAEIAKVVTVPAGEFSNCVVIEENRSAPARVVRTTYAPGTGPIAVDLLVHDEVSGVFQPALRARLRGVTAPGADPVSLPP